MKYACCYLTLVSLAVVLFAAPLAAESSTQWSRSHLSQTYFAIKKGLALDIEETRGRPRTVDLGPGCVILEAIRFDGQFGKDGTGALAFHAFRLLTVERELRLFPRYLWITELARLERPSELKRIFASHLDDADDSDDAFDRREIAFDALANKLNRYRSTHRYLPKVEVTQLMCTGEVSKEIQIVTIPEAQRIRIINHHLYSLCRDQGYDPVDFKNCGRWTDFSDVGRIMYGRYKVFVVWPNGQTGLRDLDTEAVQLGKRGNLILEIKQ
jgi:hypothetical protein